MIWLSTVWDSHSTQLQGPTGRFDGQFIKLKICFQPGVSGFLETVDVEIALAHDCHSGDRV